MVNVFGKVDSMLLYPIYDAQQLWYAPLHLVAEATEMALRHPFCPLSYTELGRLMALAAEDFGRHTTLRRSKPVMKLDDISFRGVPLQIHQEIVQETPFGKLIHFKRTCDDSSITARLYHDPRVLLIAPYDGHYATLLRDMVETLLPEHDLFITDWTDAKFVPDSAGPFSLESAIEWVMDHIHFLGGAPLHLVAPFEAGIVGVCATALLADSDEHRPASLTLLGSPINARDSQSALGYTAEQHPLGWFEENLTYQVPFYYPGAFRRVHPYFAQEPAATALSSNLSVLAGDTQNSFEQLMRGVQTTPAEYNRFFEEYLTVMDIPAEYFLQMIGRVYQTFDLLRGAFYCQGCLVDLASIEETAILTIEAEQDNITPAGQTSYLHRLCRSLPPSQRATHLEIGIGHYGLIQGRQWRNHIAPVLAAFIRQHNRS